MRKRMMILGLSLALFMGLTGVTLAAGGGNGSGTAQLNIANPVTVSGSIEDLANFLPGESQGNRGTGSSYIVLRTREGKELRLIVGPVWYLNSLDLNLAEGDSITVSGHYEADGDLVAFQIRKEGVDYVLREAEGRPLWAQEGQAGFGLKGQNLDARRGLGNGPRGGQSQTCNLACPYCMNP